MKWLTILAILTIFVITGCNSGITGYTTISDEDAETLITDCINSCAKCNPVALSGPCKENCQGYYEFGGIEKVKKYIDLYQDKCKTISNE